MSTSIPNALPDTPVGRQVAWLLANSGGAVDVASVEEHFAPSFLAAVSAVQVAEIMKSTGWIKDAEVRLDGGAEHELKASLVVDDSVRAVITASVEDAEPHRFVSLLVRPPGPTMPEVIASAEPIEGSLADAARARYEPIASALEAGGIVVGVSRRGERDVFTFGADTNVRYEIGSITKTFTGLLLADMTVRGEVQIDDPIRKYLPDGVEVPREPGREITLEDLATQSSGLPRLAPNMTTGSDPADPYAHIDAERMYAELAATTLAYPIGTQNLYSNYGFALLGHVLSLAGGKPFADLVSERILEPLGMGRTAFSPGGDDLAQGHMGAEPAPRWTGELSQGAGVGLESTVEDMLRYGEANADPSSTPIAPALTEAHRGRSAVGEIGTQALGWIRLRLRERSEALFHNGGTAGFSSSLACHPPTRTVVVVLCNSGGTDLDAATVGLLACLATG